MFFVPVSDTHVKKEREKARELRRSRWWREVVNGGTCYYCGGTSAELTMDHKVPLIRGGYSSRSNVVPACKECNTKKGYQTVTEFLQKRSIPDVE